LFVHQFVEWEDVVPSQLAPKSCSRSQVTDRAGMISNSSLKADRSSLYLRLG